MDDKQLPPSEVLLYFDEPLIYTANRAHGTLLLLKVDEIPQSGGSRYLATYVSQKTVCALKDGRRTLRSVYVSSWCWLYDLDREFGILDVVGVEGSEIQDDYLPLPGYGLYVEHGIIDEPQPECFVRLSFKGGMLGQNTMPLGVLKNLVDGVYASMRAIFRPVIEAAVPDTVGEKSIDSALQIPVFEPQFASLSLLIDIPSIDTNELDAREGVIDREAIEEKFREALRAFLKDAGEIVQLESASAIANEFAHNDSHALQILSRLAPSLGSSFDHLEISSNEISSEHKRLIITGSKGQDIHEAAKQVRSEIREIGGVIVEVNHISNSFIIRNDKNRKQVTCLLRIKRVSEEIPVFRKGMAVTVFGHFEKRVRRDLIRVEKVVMPDGRVIEDPRSNL